MAGPPQSKNKVIRAINAFRLKRGFNKLKRNLAGLNGNMNAEQVIDFLFSPKGVLIAPWQFKEEILQLAKTYEKHKPAVAMEIGTANGGTLFMHSKLAVKNAFIISLDLPGGRFGGGYPEWKEPIYKSFAKPGDTIELLRADSHQQSSLDKVKQLLNGRKLDYLFIDGDHTYEGVKKDFEMYSPLVKEKGIVVFHDIAHHTVWTCDVDKFWNEIKTKYRFEEYLKTPPQGQFGVGALYL